MKQTHLSFCCATELPDRTSPYRPTRGCSCHLRHSHPSHYILLSITDSAGTASTSLPADLIRSYDILLEARTHITIVRAKIEGNFHTRPHDLQCMMDDWPSLVSHQLTQQLIYFAISWACTWAKNRNINKKDGLGTIVPGQDTIPSRFLV